MLAIKQEQNPPRWLSGKESACPMQEMRVQSLGQKDPLEEEMATLLRYSCLGNPMDRGAWGLQSMGLQKSWAGLSD